jgi:hypothetical protein
VIDERIKLPVSTCWHEASHFHVRLEGGDVVVDARRLVTAEQAVA